MTVNVRSRRINPRITAPTVVKLMPSIVLETELRRGSRSPARIVCTGCTTCTIAAAAIIGGEETRKM